MYFHPCILFSFYHYHLYSLLPFHSPISVLHFPWYFATAYCFYCVCVCVCVCVCIYIYIYVSCYVLPLYFLAFSSFSIFHFDLHCPHVFSPPKIFNLQPFLGHKMPPSYTTPICLLLNTLQPFYRAQDSLYTTPIHSLLQGYSTALFQNTRHH